MQSSASGTFFPSIQDCVVEKVLFSIDVDEWLIVPVVSEFEGLDELWKYWVEYIVGWADVCGGEGIVAYELEAIGGERVDVDETENRVEEDVFWGNDVE